MTKLTTKARHKIPKQEFGLPGEKKYPMPDKNHARNAKARASQMENEGKLSASSKARIDAKANKILGESKMKHKDGKVAKDGHKDGKKGKSPAADDTKKSLKGKMPKGSHKLMSMHGGSMGKATYDDLDDDM